MKKLFIIVIFILSGSIALAGTDSIVVPGVYLVKYAQGHTVSTNIIGVKSIRGTAVKGVYRVKMDKAISPATGVALLGAQSGIDIVEPLRLYRLMDTKAVPFFTPNDSLLAQQWYLNKIAAPAAWDITTGTASIVVAVIDTGVEPGHADLVDSLWHNPREIPANGIDDDNNGYTDDVIGWDFVDLSIDPEISSVLAIYGTSNVEDYSVQDGEPLDVLGHGTHVAGIIAGTINNSNGIAGVAPGIKIMCLKAGFRTESGGLFTSETILNSIAYARNNGARIINMSFGDTVDDQLIHQELEAAYQQGILLVAAAGNENSDQLNYPAAIPYVLAVGATDSYDARAGFSSYGAWVDIAAPGLSILSSVSNINDRSAPQIISGVVDNKYALFSGTSMAAPVVCGVAGLMLSINPALTPAAVDYILKQTSDRIASGYNIGAGRINALNAVQYQGVTSNIAQAANFIQKIYIAPNPVLRRLIDPARIKLISNSVLSEIDYELFSQSGQKVWSARQDSSGIGPVYEIEWNVISNDGERLPVGIYYLRVKARDIKGNSDVAKTKILLLD